jgi:exo-1,4-beta-D-glucosaminidase
MGEPKLHNLTIKIINERKAYIYKRKIGLRQVSSELDEKEKKRVYKINNKKILLKGAGWTPDLFLRQSPENYWSHISYVRDMELNVIRLEGKSEGEEFYDYCDKLGILVISGWNCADAWQRWENWNLEVQELSNKSVISQIRKLSPHPSVIIFILGSDVAPRNGMEEKWRKIFQDENWPNEILSSAAENPVKDYPTGVKMSGPYSWVPPNYFFLEKSKNNNFGGAWGFLTEGGPGENPLRKGSFEKIFDEENMYNYTGDSWNYHCGNKKVFGDLDKIITPINERYGNISDFDDFQRKSCAITYESHRAMFEAYSCNKYNSTGVIQWMLNNAWPSNIWHLYDYFFSPTPTYFATKKAGEKIHVMYNYEDSSIYLLNNYFEDYKDKLTLNVYVISGMNGKEILEHKYYTYDTIKGDEIIKIDKIDNSNYTDIYILHLEYSFIVNGTNNSLTNTYWLNKEMDEINYEVVTYYNVGIKKYADLTSLQSISKTNLLFEIIEKKFSSE